MRASVRHDPAELASFDLAVDQLDYRIATVLHELDEAGITLDSIDAFSGGCGKSEIMGVIGKTGGLLGLLGTDDVLTIKERIASSDEWAKLVYEAMAYQTAKAIAGYAAVLKV